MAPRVPETEPDGRKLAEQRRLPRRIQRAPPQGAQPHGVLIRRTNEQCAQIGKERQQHVLVRANCVGGLLIVSQCEPLHPGCANRVLDNEMKESPGHIDKIEINGTVEEDLGGRFDAP